MTVAAIERRKIVDILIGVMAVAMVAVGGPVFYMYISGGVPAADSGYSQRTDFGAEAPADFPADIPIEWGTEIKQSYRLDYVGQKQLTVLFLSSKTVDENYALYSNFLGAHSWDIVNRYVDPKLSSLYATKGGDIINVIMSGDIADPSAKSEVNISVVVGQ